MGDAPAWRAEGLLFENCNCALLCRAHLSYKNLCDFERCLFHWGIRFEDGAYGDVPLGGLSVFIIGDAPRMMIDGDWTEAIYIDAAAEPAQRQALETILTGKAGGPWKILAGFVARWLEIRYVPIAFAAQGKRKSMSIEGILATSVEAIRSDDGEGEVRFENLHNKIHAPSQVIATGSTSFEDQGLSLDTEGTHAIYSRFSWRGP